MLRSCPTTNFETLTWYADSRRHHNTRNKIRRLTTLKQARTHRKYGKFAEHQFFVYRGYNGPD